MIKTMAPWVVAGLLSIPSMYNWIESRAPATDWLEAGEVLVLPSERGTAPRIEYSRVVKKSFLGEWSATVRRLSPEGLEVVCSANGVSEYIHDSNLPKKLDLDRWTYPIKCDLLEGKYRLDTTWNVKPNGRSEKQVTRHSNIFEVYPRAQ